MTTFGVLKPDADFDPSEGNEKMSEIPKFKMADGRHTENHFWL